MPCNPHDFGMRVDKKARNAGFFVKVSDSMTVSPAQANARSIFVMPMHSNRQN